MQQSQYTRSGNQQTPQQGGVGRQARSSNSFMDTLQKRWKMIAGMAVVLVLVVGTGVGLYLSQQDQDVRQQASGISCGSITCPDGTTFGPDPNAPQSSCAQREAEACANHQGGGNNGGNPGGDDGNPGGANDCADNQYFCAGCGGFCLSKSDGRTCTEAQDDRCGQRPCWETGTCAGCDWNGGKCISGYIVNCVDPNPKDNNSTKVRQTTDQRCGGTGGGGTPQTINCSTANTATIICTSSDGCICGSGCQNPNSTINENAFCKKDTSSSNFLNCTGKGSVICTDSNGCVCGDDCRSRGSSVEENGVCVGRNTIRETLDCSSTTNATVICTDSDGCKCGTGCQNEGSTIDENAFCKKDRDFGRCWVAQNNSCRSYAESSTVCQNSSNAYDTQDACERTFTSSEAQCWVKPFGSCSAFYNQQGCEDYESGGGETFSSQANCENDISDVAQCFVKPFGSCIAYYNQEGCQDYRNGGGTTYPDIGSCRRSDNSDQDRDIACWVNPLGSCLPYYEQQGCNDYENGGGTTYDSESACEGAGGVPISDAKLGSTDPSDWNSCDYIQGYECRNQCLQDVLGGCQQSGRRLANNYQAVVDFINDTPTCSVRQVDCAGTSGANLVYQTNVNCTQACLDEEPVETTPPATLPPGETPLPESTPPAGAMCMSIQINRAGDKGPNDAIAVGDSISLTCGQVGGAQSYDFRYAVWGSGQGWMGQNIRPAGSARQSESFIVNSQGQHIVQCRPCFGPNQSNCMQWEDPGSLTN